MPLYGLGTWLSKGDSCYDACKTVLTTHNVRLLDTATLYQNENLVGRALRDSGVPREDVFITTKLHVDHHHRAREALQESLDRLGIKQVDLYLIHTPKGGNVVEAWKTLLECQKEGLAAHVGVSNFGVEHLRKLEECGLARPAVNQVELHVFNPQQEMRDYCKEKGIVVMGYCPLARCKKFGNQVLTRVANKYNKTESQVMIRWSLEKGVVTIPKSTNPVHIQENADVFDFQLSSEDMAALDELADGFEASTSVTNQLLPWDSVK